MPVKFKNYEADPADKYDESWRRYGDRGTDALNGSSGLLSISLITTQDGQKTLSVTGDTSQKSEDYVRQNIQALLKAGGLEADAETKGSTVTCRIRGVNDDAVMNAVRALSGEPVGSYYPMLETDVAKQIMTREGEIKVGAVTGRAVAETTPHIKA